MYAEITNLQNDKTVITGSYKTLTALTQNAVLFYWNKNNKCNMLVKYYSSFDVPIEFKIEYFDANGLRRES
jgi:hypothetical protein